MIELLTLIALWCPNPRWGFDKSMDCRKRIFECIMIKKPLVLTHPKNAKLIKSCIESNTWVRP